MSMNQELCSIVEFMTRIDDGRGSSCGYCKSGSGSHSQGMWAHLMTVADYQDLIDRGWRRSGKYCYKPNMRVTCCPLYAIRCDTLELKLNKSHKNVMRKLNRFLSSGEHKDVTMTDGMETETSTYNEDIQCEAKCEPKLSMHNFPESFKEIKNESDVNPPAENSTTSDNCENVTLEQKEKTKETKLELAKQPKPSLGPDPNKPPCKKAKLRRLEKREKKNATQMPQPAASAKSQGNVAKSLEEHMKLHNENSVHKLEIRLVRSNPQSNECSRTLAQSYQVYRKYQEIVHNDPPHKCTQTQFERFLVNSPLMIKLVKLCPPSEEYMKTRMASHSLFQKYQMKIHNDFDCDYDTYEQFLEDSPLKFQNSSAGPGFGSFHQQYWLDGKIIAVGVIDILPQCVSSVYFYYDPDYRFLTLGTYASLQEIAFTRQLQKSVPSLKYYYMGFYIHSCPKMRYKGQYCPSYLLCPEVYTWHPIENCKPKLEQSKYSRLEEDSRKVDDNLIDVAHIGVLYSRTAMNFSVYQRQDPLNNSDTEKEEVSQYAKLVGGKCARRMLLYRE